MANEIFLELDEVCSKYERLHSMIEILQIFTAEIGEIVGVKYHSFADTLYEIELAMEKNNNRLISILSHKGGAE